MQTKEKLELGWKYLSTVLLFVLGVMFIRSADNNSMKSLSLNKKDDMVFIMDKKFNPNVDELDVKVNLFSDPNQLSFVTVQLINMSKDNF